MKVKHAFLILAMLCISCGDDGSGPDDGGGGNNNDPDPTPTPVGTSVGAPVTETIGAAGGSVTSADGLFTVDIPAGALAADTDISVEPITNEAWGGSGSGYRLAPDGLTFATAVDVVFTLNPDSLVSTDLAGVDVATQRDDGVWGILKNQTLNEGSATLTATTTHFSDYSLVEGIQIRPRRKFLNPNQSVTLTIRICERQTFDDPDLTALLITCDEELVPLATAEDWSVNGVVGGNSTVGNVSPTDGPQTIYTAPDVAPVVNPVTVSVNVDYASVQGPLTARIYINPVETWRGQITAQYPNGDKAVAILEFVYIGTFEGEKWFTPEGPVTYTLGFGDCDFVSLSPSSTVFTGSEGIMEIDYRVDPPTVFIGIGTSWQANHCYQCPEHPVQCSGIQLAVGMFTSDVLGGPNLDVIDVLGKVEDSVTYTYRFDKL